MSVDIFCPNCSDKAKSLKDWKSYAEHILDKHPNDAERCQWANDVLKDGCNKQEAPEVKKDNRSLVRKMRAAKSAKES